MVDRLIALVSIAYSGDFSLMRGNASLAIILGDLYCQYGYEAFKNRSCDLCEEISINLNKYQNCTLGNGLIGGLYTIGYLKKINLLDVEDDFFAEYDNVIFSFVEDCEKHKNYDLNYGLIGAGLYYLLLSEIYPVYESKLCKIVSGLFDLSIDSDTDVKWCRENDSSVFFDWGLLHGIPSIISFLLICFRSHTLLDKYEFVMEKSLMSILNSINLEMKDFSCFHMTSCNSFSKFKFRSRLGYCYGDLGIINTLLLANKCLKEESYLFWSKYMMNKLLDRLDVYNKEVSDPYFCHGISGIYKLLKNINSVLKNNRLNLIENRMRGDLEKYLINLHDENLVFDLLDGDIGVVFSYLSDSCDLCGLERLLLIK